MLQMYGEVHRYIFLIKMFKDMCVVQMWYRLLGVVQMCECGTDFSVWYKMCYRCLALIRMCYRFVDAVQVSRHGTDVL